MTTEGLQSSNVIGVRAQGVVRIRSLDRRFAERHREFRPRETTFRTDDTGWLPELDGHLGTLDEVHEIPSPISGPLVHGRDQVVQRRARIHNRDALLNSLALELWPIPPQALAILVVPPIGGNQAVDGKLEVEYRPCDGFG